MRGINNCDSQLAFNLYLNSPKAILLVALKTINTIMMISRETIKIKVPNA